MLSPNSICLCLAISLLSSVSKWEESEKRMKEKDRHSELDFGLGGVKGDSFALDITCWKKDDFFGVASGEIELFLLASSWLPIKTDGVDATVKANGD